MIKRVVEYFDYDAHVADCLTSQTASHVDADGNEVTPWNEHLVEAAGFVPLEVRFKQMEQNGLMAQFMTSELSPEDMRQIYLSAEFEVRPDDEFEDALIKVQRRRKLEQILLEERKKAQEDAEKNNPHVLSAAEYEQFKKLAASFSAAPQASKEQTETTVKS